MDSLDEKLEEIKSSIKSSSHLNEMAYSIAVIALGITTVALGITGSITYLGTSNKYIAYISIILMVLGYIPLIYGIYKMYDIYKSQKSKHF